MHIDLDPPLHEQQLGTPRPIRLYAVDEIALESLSERTGKSMVELTRKAVHAGIVILNEAIPESQTKHNTTK